MPSWRPATPDDGPHAHACACWIRTGAPFTRRDGRAVTLARALWQDENGPLPEGTVLGSLCFTHLCVRPSHHAPSTRSEVSYRSGVSRLTPEVAERLREAVERGWSVRRAADLFNVSPATAHRVARGEHWTARGVKPPQGDTR